MCSTSNSESVKYLVILTKALLPSRFDDLRVKLIVCDSTQFTPILACGGIVERVDRF